ncbi:hypothetical protein LUZ60_005416 [Juncus effusus]|nr:hypothetical protein LUZ60_005416 [Juncus effusus]
MAKAAIVESTQAHDFPFKKTELVVKMKRKTPSELREEQLKRRENQKLAEKESQPFKVPKYVNTRVSEVYPVKKSSGLQSLKEKTKDSKRENEKANNNTSTLPCPNEETNSKESIFKTTEQCSQSQLRNVIQLHRKDEISVPSTTINMEKAFKGFGVPARSSQPSSLFSDPSGRSADVDQSPRDTCPTQFKIPGNKSPLDLILKTSLRLVSSASVKWCQRVNPSYAFQSCGCQAGPTSSKEAVLSKALCSWIYPQCNLPLSVIYAMGSSNGKAEKEFLEKRRQDWEDSFKNLYYMLRKNICSIFYVYTSEFVALFVGCDVNSGEKQKRSCDAYLSKSTRKLRSLLKKNGVNFSMPLSSNEEEEESEDLEEILEFQRKNLGQAILSDSFSEIDNTSESLLSIAGNNNVHALYDFLLNHRFFVSSFNRGDVPSLYSPIPFQNSSLNFPQVRCKEMRKADGLVDQENNNENGFELNNNNNNDKNMCYSIEISNSIIPPWVISGVCQALSMDGKSFDSIFTNDSSSKGLNIALKSTFGKSDFSDGENSSNTFGISNSVSVATLHSGSVQRLKYTNGAYVAYTA